MGRSGIFDRETGGMGSGFEFEVKQPVKDRHTADESNYPGSVIGSRDNKCNIENHK
jgi:hypothetical protein